MMNLLITGSVPPISVVGIRMVNTLNIIFRRILPAVFGIEPFATTKYRLNSASKYNGKRAQAMPIPNSRKE